MNASALLLLAIGGTSPAAPAVNVLWACPFALLLLCIALMPFVNRHFWERHYAKIAIGLAVLPAVYYLLVLRAPAPWLGAMEEYLSFICLLASLFVISGGIVIRVNRKATPLANCALLLLGAIAANVFGTTGASMLLIRPFIRMNRGHIKPYHIIFFIFIVANCGGMLTPIGDPPLFLGYLEGVPFRWTLDHLWPIWATAVGVLLAIFFILDTLDHRRSDRAPAPAAASHGDAQVHILGIHNFIFISGVLFAVFRPSIFEVIAEMTARGFAPGRLGGLLLCREVIMTAAALASLRLTAREIYRHNEFSYGPIREVAILFVGIFSTMAPALGWLEQNARTLEVRTPGQFYYTCGTLSAFLDNAPTYLTFLKMELGRLEPAEVRQVQAIVASMRELQGIERAGSDELSRDARQAVGAAVESHRDRILDGTMTENQVKVAFLLGNPALSAFLVAISASAVLFGACTYIGNGPNFMVRSIAQASGCKTPGFLGYILCYSLPILLPLYTLIWLLFL